MTELEQLLKEHAVIVAKAASSYVSFRLAQDAHLKDRDAEHKSYDKLTDFINTQVTTAVNAVAGVNGLPTIYKPVGTDKW